MADSTQAPKDLMGFLEFYLVQKAPFQIPDGGKEWIVKYGPWITVVLLILSLPLILIALGIGTVLVPFAGVGYATGFGYLAILTLVTVGLQVAALPGLFARKMSGWNLIFYSRIVSFIGSLLMGALISAILGALISLYILFQIRPLYRTT
jgi:hypothetical protein